MRGIALVSTLLALLAAEAATRAAAQPAPSPTPQERAAVVRQRLADSQQRLLAYEWVETTVVSLKGEEKSRQQKRCYYDVTGALQKVVLNATPEASVRGPLRRAVAENKKEELSATLQSAVALVHAYVPPAPADIQAAVAAGKLALAVLEPGRRVRLDFRDFKKPGDTLGLELETTANQLLGVTVSSYLETPEDPVSLSVTLASLPDGTAHVARAALAAPDEELAVTVENGGYRPVGR